VKHSGLHWGLLSSLPGRLLVVPLGFTGTGAQIGTGRHAWLGIQSGAPLGTSWVGGVLGVVEGLALGETLGPPLGAYSVSY
jgi:hypothetical protein